ncbi:MAG: uroporphyrinogen-III C-methyltransferase [Burkholderiales bacterium]
MNPQYDRKSADRNALPVVGKATLIGAGPGDIELLTLKAVKALGEADVVLLDDLVNREVLQFLKPGARVIEVGKRGGKGRCGRSTPQAFIERLIVRYAKRGLIVARVKGGDPFVFGRGGEEAATLRAAGIPVEVISGITAGIGVPAALGIPVTHRDFVHGVTLVTGHTRGGDAPNWRALAASGTTLVIYMGISNLASIIDALLEAGMPASMPVAVIQDGTLPTQRALLSNLNDVVARVAQAGLGSPALLVVGEVSRFAASALLESTLRQNARRAA